DRPFLVNLQLLPEARHLHVAGAQHRLDCGCQKQGIDRHECSRWSLVVSRENEAVVVSQDQRLTTNDESRLHRSIGDVAGGAALPAATRFTIRISMPPCRTRCSCTSSMKLRMRKIPRPLDFSRFSGASGFATSSGSKPSP